jgi:hypothetical protein
VGRGGEGAGRMGGRGTMWQSDDSGRVRSRAGGGMRQFTAGDGSGDVVKVRVLGEGPLRSSVEISDCKRFGGRR